MIRQKLISWSDQSGYKFYLDTVYIPYIVYDITYHYTLYTVLCIHCTLYTVHCTWMYSVQCTMYTMTTVHTTTRDPIDTRTTDNKILILDSPDWENYNTTVEVSRRTVYAVQCTPYSVRCTAWRVWSTACKTTSAMHRGVNRRCAQLIPGVSLTPSSRHALTSRPRLNYASARPWITEPWIPRFWLATWIILLSYLCSEFEFRLDRTPVRTPLNSLKQ